MSTSSLFNLYQENNTATNFTEGDGFSVIRSYKDRRLKSYRLMIKLLLNEKSEIIGEVNTVRPKGEVNTEYSLVEDSKLNLNSFYFSGGDITLKDGFAYTKSGEKLTLSELVDALEKTHLSKFINLKLRALKLFYSTLIFVLVWLGDTSYSYPEEDEYESMNPYNYKERIIKKQDIKKKEPDPLFKYFYINKNVFIFSAAVASIFLLVNQPYYAQDITKISSVIFGLSILILLEEASRRINNILFNDSDDSYIQKVIQRSRGDGQSFNLLT
jgi:hypothetical protein